MQRIIGIDFGTSTTYMNVKRYNGDQPAEDRFSYMPVVFNYGESSGFVSSIVRENADGTFDFGEKAREQLEGSHIYEEVKMFLESPDPVKRDEARRVTEQFFRFLHETYIQQAANLGSAEDTEETIVSYPVKWQKETVRFMLDTARKAGFQNVHGMDEATAAVSAVLCQNTNSNLIQAGKSGYLMLVDMGAGTTDLVVCRYEADEQNGIQVELVTSWPRTPDQPTFGGREIDTVLEQYVEAYLTKALSPALASMAHGFAADPGKAKMWKERNVSSGLAEHRQITTCAYLAPYRPMLTGSFPPFGRAEFEQLAADGLRDYVRLLQGCLADTEEADDEFSEAGLDLVILTGGHSTWYFAREIVDGTMEGWLEHPALELVRSQKARVFNLPNPQTTVSLGLVYSKLPFRLAKEEPPAPPAGQTLGASAAQGPEERPAPLTGDTGRPTEGEWILSIVEDAIRNDPEFYETNQCGDTGLVAAMSAQIGISPRDKILYASVSGDSGKSLHGYLLSDSGIYTRCFAGPVAGFSNSYMEWKEAIGSTTCYSGGLRLQFGTRKLDLPDRNVLRALEGLLDKLRGKPRGPYRWTAAMRNTVLDFLRTDPEIVRRNARAQFPNGTKFWSKLESRYPFEVYYVGLFGSGGRHRAIIHAGGLSVRYSQGSLGYSNGPREVIPWEDFLNMDLDAPGYIYQYIHQDFGIAPSLHALQQLLRSQASPSGGWDAPHQEGGSAGGAQQDTSFVPPPQNTVYDSSKCPNCGTAIPAGAKKCPLCKRKKLPDLVTPFKIGGLAWHEGEKKVGIAKAAVGSFTIHNDRIEYKRRFGNAAGAVIPYYNIYSLAKANLSPAVIFWIRDLAEVKETTYFLGVPSLVIVMRNGRAYTFAAPIKTESYQDSIRGAVALLQRLIGS